MFCNNSTTFNAIKIPDYANLNFLSLDANDQKKCGFLKNYIKPDHVCGIVGWVVYRIWNAVKSVFGCSDWQIAKKNLTDIFSTRYKDKSNFQELVKFATDYHLLLLTDRKFHASLKIFDIKTSFKIFDLKISIVLSKCQGELVALDMALAPFHKINQSSTYEDALEVVRCFSDDRIKKMINPILQKMEFGLVNEAIFEPQTAKAWRIYTEHHTTCGFIIYITAFKKK